MVEAKSLQDPRHRAKPARSTRSRPDVLTGLLDLRRGLELEMGRCQSEFSGNGIRLSDGDDPAERTSQSLLVNTMNHINSRLREVDQALNQVTKGYYGTCVECGKRISQERLKANPTSQRCFKCQVLREKR